MKKTLSDFPEYANAKKRHDDAVAVLGEKLTERESVAGQLHAARAGGETLIHDGENYVSVKLFFDRLGELDQSILTNKRAVELARAEVERARGQASVEICREARPAFIEQIEVILKALKQICGANAELEQLRGELQREDIESGTTIPHCLCQGVGSWDDRLKVGAAIMFQESIKRGFSDVKF
jgi:multidrug resistance efflux pump